MPCRVEGEPFFGFTCFYFNMFELARGNDATTLHAFCNRPNGSIATDPRLVERVFSRTSTPGPHAISNTHLDEVYKWPKVRTMRDGVGAAVRVALSAPGAAFDRGALEAALSTLLLSEEVYPRDALPPLEEFAPGAYDSEYHLQVPTAITHMHSHMHSHIYSLP